MNSEINSLCETIMEKDKEIAKLQAEKNKLLICVKHFGLLDNDGEYGYSEAYKCLEELGIE